MNNILIFLHTDLGNLTGWLVFILILMGVDILTGFWQALVNKTVQSKASSMGILKKFSLLIVLLSVVPLTFLMPDIITIPVIVGVYLMEIINEFISIFENLKKMGINVKPFEKILSLLKSETKGDNEK